jgi:transcriptional repressor NrdR
MEQMELLNIQVEKRSGELQSYSRDKLTAGLRRALEKRPVDDEKIDRLVSAIERDVQKLGQGVVSSTVIGEIVMRHLRKTDQIAYIRFASVYRSFEDLETFREELIKIIPTKQKKSSTI